MDCSGGKASFNAVVEQGSPHYYVETVEKWIFFIIHGKFFGQRWMIDVVIF